MSFTRTAALVGSVGVLASAVLLAGPAVPAQALTGPEVYSDALSQTLTADHLSVLDGFRLEDNPAGGTLGKAGTVTVVNSQTGATALLSTDGVSSFRRLDEVEVLSRSGGRLSAPSSVLASGMPAGLSSSSAAQTALSESELLRTGGRLAAVGSTLGRASNVFGVVSGGLSIGLAIGGGLDTLGCAAGIVYVCDPRKSPAGYQVNSDQSVVTNDTGWKGGVNTVTIGGYPVTFDLIAPVPQLNSGGYAYMHAHYADGGCPGGTSNQWAINYNGDPVPGATSPRTPYFNSCQYSGGSWSGNGSYTGAQLDRAIIIGADGATSFDDPRNIVWFPPWSSLRPAPSTTSPDPQRQWRSQSECSGGTTVEGLSPLFREAQASWPQYPLTSPCPAGQHPVNWKVDETSPDGAATRTVETQDVPAEVQRWQADNPDECSTGSCTLDLQKQTSPGVWPSCYSIGDACAQWDTDPNLTSDYRCEYGPSGQLRELSISECNALSPAFDPQQTEKRAPVGDPRTITRPDPPPRPTTAPEPVPQPSAPGEPVPAPLPVPTTTDSCWPTGWAAVFNPLSWVLQPGKCALTWAFVPDPVRTERSVQSVRTAWDGTSPAQWTGAVGVALAPLSAVRTSAAGCDGPVISGRLPLYGQLVIHPVSTCAEPMRTVAEVVRIGLTVVVWFGALLLGAKSLAAGFGYSAPTGGDSS